MQVETEMEKNDDQKEIVTTREVIKIIQQGEYGEYDQFHDWSPSYTLQNKADLLENMLNNWDKTEPEGRKLIIQFIRILIKESGSSALVITNKLVPYAQLPEVIRVVNEFLFSGLFCQDLLVSMKNYQVRQEDWLKKIRNISTERKFIEKKREINHKDLYRKINELILELS
jgi:hypothetical protein